MKKIITRQHVLTLIVTLLLAAHLVGLGEKPADAAGCGREINANWVACRHRVQHGHQQWNHGQGTPGHTWASYQQQARALRRYLAVIAHRQALVRNWSGVAQCESGGNWSINTGNGYYGGVQFSLSTWSAYGGRGMPHQQPPWYQATIADRVRVQSSLGHWPSCGSRYG